MNRNSFALFVALLIHLLIFLLLFILTTQLPHINKTKHAEKRVKISLKEFKHPKQKKKKSFGETKTKPKPSPVAPPLPKGSQFKKIVQKPLPKYNPKQNRKEPKLNKEKKEQKPQKSKQKQQQLPPKNNRSFLPLEAQKNKEHNITKNEKAKTQQDNPLYSLLSQDHSDEEEQSTKKSHTASSGVLQNIKELYGDEFGKLTPGQQKYILDNQEIMRRITQEVLYRVARVNLPHDLNINATNVIEFKLHPDGSMSDFRFIKKSGIYILDRTTQETIEYAYSKYPHPKETTLIRYNVFYNLARY